VHRSEVIGGDFRHEANMDAKMWKILEQVGLADMLRTQEKGLETEIDSSGECFSVGEKQLFAVAR